MTATVAPWSQNSLFALESDPSVSSFGHPAAAAEQETQGVSWGFISGYMLCLSVLCLLLALWWQLASNSPGMRHQPQLLDAELAVSYGAEQTQSALPSQVPQSGEFASGLRSDLLWFTMLQQLQHNVQKALALKQLQRLARLQKDSLHKLKYSGFV